LWEQFTTVKGAGAEAAYVAMFDEIDEATAIIPCRNDPPVGGSTFVSYEESAGRSLPLALRPRRETPAR